PARVVEDVARDVGARVVRVGEEVRVAHASTGPGPLTRVALLGPDGAASLEVAMPVAGLHQARNAAVAVAACRLLGLEDRAIARGVASPRGLAPALLADAIRELAPFPVDVAPDAATGLSLALARARAGDVVLVTGSLYLAGAARAAARVIPGSLVEGGVRRPP